jgi:hypothetical protein
MIQRSNVRMAIGTLAVVAIALSVDSVRRTRHELATARTATRAIRSQLDAFNRNDYGEAFHFASPELREHFTLPEFRQMVERGFPRIAHSRKAVFDAAVVRGDMAMVPVTVTGQDGLETRYVYEMHREGSGWRVAGVGEPEGPGQEVGPRGGSSEPPSVGGSPPGPNRREPAGAGKPGGPKARDDI